MKSICVLLLAAIFLGPTAFAMGRPRPEARVPLNLDENRRIELLNQVKNDLTSDTWGARDGASLSQDEFVSEIRRWVDDECMRLQVGLGKESLFTDQFDYTNRLEQSSAWQSCRDDGDCDEFKEEISSATETLSSAADRVNDVISDIATEEGHRLQEIVAVSSSDTSRMALLTDLFGTADGGLVTLTNKVNAAATLAQEFTTQLQNNCYGDGRCALDATSTFMRQMMDQLRKNAAAIENYKIEAESKINKLAAAALVKHAVDAVTDFPALRVSAPN